MHNSPNNEITHEVGTNLAAFSNDASPALAEEAYSNLFCAPIKMPLDGSSEKTEDQYLIQTDAAGLKLKAAVELSNAVTKDDSDSAKKILQDAMEKGELKDVLYLTNCFLGAGDSSQRLFAVDTVEKVTYTEDRRGSHSLTPKDAQFENPRATVAVVDLDTGNVETVGTVKNDPFHKGYSAPK
ncbi:hypothetical protein BH11CYA1_BH11CYA1_00300 [soil metagenome]